MRIAHLWILGLVSLLVSTSLIAVNGQQPASKSDAASIVDALAALPGRVQLRLEPSAQSHAGKMPAEVDPDAIKMIQAKYDRAIREQFPLAWRASTEIPGYLFRDLPKNPLHAILEKKTGHPVRSLLVQAAEVILDNGVAEFVRPNAVKDLVLADYRPGSEEQFLKSVRSSFQPHLFDDPIFIKASVKNQVAIIRSLQLHANSLLKPDKKSPGVKKKLKGGSNVIGHISELHSLTSAFVDNQLQLSKDIDEGIAAVNNVLGAGLAVKEKLDWLDKGVVSHPKATGLRKVAASKVEKALGKAKGYLDAGDKLVELAGALGISGPTVKAASDVLKVGKSLRNAVGALGTGNPVAAISAIGSLLFGGPDPAEERHREVMAKLGEIQEQLNTVLENQRRIYKAIVQLDEKLTTLAIEVKKNHIEVMTKLEQIHEDVLKNRGILNEILEHNLKDIDNFLKIDNISYANRAAWLKDNRGSFDRAKAGFTRIGVSKDLPRFSAYFRFESNENGRVQQYLRDDIKPVFDYFQTLPQKEQRQLISCFVSPSFTIGQLKDKLKERATAPPVPENDFPYSQFSALLDAERVMLYGRFAMQFAPYNFLVDTSTTPPSLLNYGALSKGIAKDVLEVKTLKAIEHLSDPVRLLDVAIAQRALLSGDVLLPRLQNKLLTRKLDGRELDILRRHPVMARNVVALLVAEQLVKNGGNRFSYGIAMSSNDKEVMSLLLGDDAKHFELERKEVETETGVKEGRWFLKIANLPAVPLPSVDEFVGGTLWHVDELISLNPFRQRMIEEIASYSFHAGLSSEERRSLATLAAER